MQAAETAMRATIDGLETVYLFRQPDEVRTFLTTYPDLVDLLVEGAAKIPEFLPPDGPMAVAVILDAEDQDEEGELVVVVPTRLEPEEVRPRLERLRREWLIAALRRSSEPLVVGAEYR